MFVDRLTVACVQQRMRLPVTLDEYRDGLRRFLRAAENKRARLVIDARSSADTRVYVQSK